MESIVFTQYKNKLWNTEKYVENMYKFRCWSSKFSSFVAEVVSFQKRARINYNMSMMYPHKWIRSGLLPCLPCLSNLFHASAITTVCGSQKTHTKKNMPSVCSSVNWWEFAFVLWSHVCVNKMLPFRGKIYCDVCKDTNYKFRIGGRIRGDINC